MQRDWYSLAEIGPGLGSQSLALAVPIHTYVSLPLFSLHLLSLLQHR